MGSVKTVQMVQMYPIKTVQNGTDRVYGDSTKWYRWGLWRQNKMVQVGSMKTVQNGADGVYEDSTKWCRWGL